MRILVCLLIILISSTMTFSEILATDIVENPIARIVVGGYFLLMAYQILSPYPIVFQTSLQICSGANIGPFIFVDSCYSGNARDKIVYHELEHLYQTALINIISFPVFYSIEALKSLVRYGNQWAGNLFEKLAFKAEYKVFNGDVVPYITLKINF